MYNGDKPIEYVLAMQYAAWVDKQQFKLMKTILVERFTQRGPTWHCQSSDEFIQQLRVLPQNFQRTFHLVGNQLGEWLGDTYTGETYCVASHLYNKNGEPRKLDMAICYDEHIVLHKGNYRYQRRDANVIWQTDQPILPMAQIEL